MNMFRLFSQRNSQIPKLIWDNRGCSYASFMAFSSDLINAAGLSHNVFDKFPFQLQIQAVQRFCCAVFVAQCRGVSGSGGGGGGLLP